MSAKLVGLLPDGLLAKSTISIVEKLRRESIRLSQMQDIAGCRVVVANVVEQEQFVASLKTDWLEASVIDRRDNPSYGYRAIHMIIEISGKPIEIQVRTSLQHLWAEVSEKYSDVIDPTIKYGGGCEKLRSFFTKTSASVASYDEFEKKHSIAAAFKDVADADHEKFKNAVAELSENHGPDHSVQELREKLEESTRKMECREQEDQEMRKELARLWGVNAGLLKAELSWLDKLKGAKK